MPIQNANFDMYICFESKMEPDLPTEIYQLVIKSMRM